MITVEIEKLCYENNFNRGFWFNRTAHPLLLINIYLVLNWLNSMYYLFLGLRIKYYDSKNQNNFAVRTILIVGFYSAEEHKSYLFLYFFV